MASFTKLMRGDSPLRIADGATWVAYLHENPRCEGHALVVPKQQAARLSELPGASQAELVAGIVEVERRLSAILGTVEFTIVLQDGGTDHVHAPGHTQWAHSLHRRPATGQVTHSGPTLSTVA